MPGPFPIRPERDPYGPADRPVAFLPPPRLGEGGRGGEVCASAGGESNLSPQPPSPKRGGGLRSALLLAVLAVPLLAADSGPPPAKKVTLRGDQLTPVQAARAIREQTTIDVDVSALEAEKTFALDLRDADFWTAVGQLADRTGSKVVTTGGRIALRPGKSLAPVSVSGPFRFTVREVYARIDPDIGKSAYEVTLEVCWEPWVLAYRIDTTPSVLTATNDQGKGVPVAKDATRTLTSGNIATLVVRPAAVRTDKSLTLTGAVKVTIADRLLTFTFDAAKPQPAPAQEGVTAAVTKSGIDGADWFAVIEVRQPKSDVSVESHEYGLFRHNVARLIPPKGDPITADLVEPADLRYGFKGRAGQVGPGWKLEYRTPGPLREIVVPFKLKDVRLP